MKRPYMPLFWGDFFADTLHLSAAEIGAYLLLIAYAWQNDGVVPLDRAHRIARMNPWHWNRIKDTIEAFFEVHTVGSQRLGTNRRVLKELQYVAEISNKRKAAALQKHSKRKANGSHNALQNTSSHTHTQEKPLKGFSKGMGRAPDAKRGAFAEASPALAPASAPTPAPAPGSWEETRQKDLETLRKRQAEVASQIASIKAKPREQWTAEDIDFLRIYGA